ncbi:MAG: aminotransferase class I/II-fold pyridoxal phosphate-dependent enzyme, partial [Litoreibacter sp.]
MHDIVSPQIIGPRQFRNNHKMIPASEAAWKIAQNNGMLGLRIRFNGSQNTFIDIDSGHEFVNMCSCSYLGLNGHPDVIEGGVQALREEGTTGLAMAEFRIRLGLMEELEAELSDLFGGPVLPAVTSSALTAAILPMLGSGHLTGTGPLVMVFDRFAHFSMAFVKPIVADETLVKTIAHNDLEALEDICRKYDRVAYVCDGVYSVGGVADLGGLLALQEKYGLFLYIDDSHALSTEGANGEGYIRSRLSALNDLTMVVASTAKAFGSTGGI